MTASGIDPNYTAVLVYGDSAGSTPLWRLRPGTTEVVVVPEPSLQRNLQSRQAHEEAVGRMTLATDGRVRYRLAAERPASGVVVETKYFPEEPILHELGHTFGLHHSPDGHEVMNAPARSSGYMSPREREAMLLLLARPAGNRYPDNDRGVATAGRAQAVILCR